MNVTSFANLFHQNSIFQQNKPLGQKLVQPPINDTLKVTSTFQDGASGILAELKRRGCVQAGEEFSLDDQETADSGAAMRASLFQDIYDGIWETFKQSISNKTEMQR